MSGLLDWLSSSNPAPGAFESVPKRMNTDAAWQLQKPQTAPPASLNFIDALVRGRPNAYSRYLDQIAEANKPSAAALARRAEFDALPTWQKPFVAANDLARFFGDAFSFGFADKMEAKTEAALTGETYAQRLAKQQRETQAVRDMAGPTALPLELAGNVLTGGALAKNGLTLAGRYGTGALPGVKGLLARSGLIATEGAGYGALDAAGHDKDIGEGALFGLFLGGGGNAVVEPVVAGARKLSSVRQAAGDLISAGVEKVTNAFRSGDNGLKTLASRSTKIYDPPSKPARPFELDYPDGPRADAAGRLLEDIDGQPFTGKRVVGRRVVGGEDVSLLPSEYDAVAEATIGSVPQAVAAGALPGKAVGRYREGYSPDGSPERNIAVLNTLSPDEATKVTAHEMGHMFDSLAREWATDPKANIPAGARSELNFVYNDLNNPDLNMDRLRGFDVEGTPRKVYKGYKPENSGYKKGAESDAELLAEFARAYMADPNYVKTVAPKAAKWWRSRVNPHPLFRNIIQFNSLAAALAPVGLMGYLAEQQGEQQAKPPSPSAL